MWFRCNEPENRSFAFWRCFDHGWSYIAEDRTSGSNARMTLPIALRNPASLMVQGGHPARPFAVSGSPSCIGIYIPVTRSFLPTQKSKSLIFRTVTMVNCFSNGLIE